MGNHLPSPPRFEAKKPRLQHMVIVGDTGPDFAKIWVKVPVEGKWGLVISKHKFNGDLDDMDGKELDNWFQNYPDLNVHSYAFLRDEGLCHTFKLDGLDANTRYYYLVSADVSTKIQEAGRTIIGDTAEAYFDTAKTDYHDIRFASFSCHDPYSWTHPKEGALPELCDVAEREQLDLLIAAGDQVYLDTNDGRMTDLWKWLARYKNELEQKSDLDIKHYLVGLIREYYKIYWNFEALSDVFGRYPSYMIWDDHEIMDGWGSRTKEERRKLLRHFFQFDDDSFNVKVVDLTWQAAAQVYFEYQHDHNPGRQQRGDLLALEEMQWDYSFNRGSFHYYVLDVRGHHDCERETYRLLGKAQFERVKAWLNRLSDAEAAFIVSPVPVVHWSGLVDIADFSLSGMKDDLMDEWSHHTNHAERDELLTEVLQVSHSFAVPISFISGDVHCASAYQLIDISRFPNAQVSQITSSPISRKPNPAIANLVVAKSGYMQKEITRLNEETGKMENTGKKEATSVYQKRLFAKSGINNFAIIRAVSGSRSIAADFYWPGEEDEEIVRKNIKLTSKD